MYSGARKIGISGSVLFPETQQKRPRKRSLQEESYGKQRGFLGARLRRINLRFITRHHLPHLPPQLLQGVCLIFFRLRDLRLTPPLRRVIIDANWVRTIEHGTLNFLSLLLPFVTCRETVCCFEEALLRSATPKKIALVANPLQLLLS